MPSSITSGVTLEKLSRIQLRPTGPTDARGKVLLHRSQHGVSALFVDLAEPEHVRTQETPLADVVGYHLNESAGVQVGSLLDLNQLADNLLGSCDPAQAYTG
jgi:hypothetical protein